MKAINYASFKLKEKINRSVKQNKSNFINIMGDKFAMSIRREKLKIYNFILPDAFQLYELSSVT